MKKLFILVLFVLVENLFCQTSNPELVIGKVRVEPGILFIFEGAIKDNIMPSSMHLSENETNIHIEARVNWDVDNIPNGAVQSGFIPYLHINAKVINEKTGLSTFIDLVPHINLIDNFHYARNISLPGSINDLYAVQFNIIPPTQIDMSVHMDWVEEYGKELMEECSFFYENVNFKEVAQAKRR